MPKFVVVRPSVVVAATTALVAATAVVLLVSTVSAPPAGAAITPGSTVIASVHDGTNAPQGSGEFSSGSVISADGGSIAFVDSGRLEGLDPGETSNVYVRDLVKRRTVMISRGQFKPDTGTTTSEPTFVPPRLSGDKPMSFNGPRRAQPAQPFETSPDGSSSDPSISANGRFVAFATGSNNIVHKDPHDNVFNNDIVIADRDPDGNGVYDENFPGTTVRNYHYVLVDTGNGTSDIVLRQQPHLSADGGRIVWAEEYFGEGQRRDAVWAADIVKNATGGIDSVANVREVPTESRTFFSHDPEQPRISGDGNHVVMNVIPGCSFDECPDAMATISADLNNPTDITRVDFDGTAPIGTGPDIEERNPAINFDGTVIAFEEEKFVDDGDGGRFPNNTPNVYVVRVDYTKPATTLRVTRSTVVSRDNSFGTVNGAQPALSADGRYVAFVTDALRTHDGVDRPTTSFNCLNQQPGLTNSKPLRLNALPPDRNNPQRTNCQIVMRDLTVDQDRLVAKQTFLPGTLASPGLQRDCSRTLASDQTCAGQNDSFNPSLTADGSQIGFDSSAKDLVQDDNNNRDDVFVRTLQPTLQTSAVDFGPVEIPQNIVRTAQLTEVGNGPLPVQTVTLAGPNAADFTITGQTCQGATLHEAEGCAISVQFAPTATGNRTGQLVVTVRGGRTFTVNLAGSGTAKPVPRGPEFSAEPLDFGQRLPLSTGPDLILNVTNNGDQPLTLSGITPVAPGAPGDYSIPSNACAGVNLPAGGTCKITVRFTPTAPGDRSAVLQITDNAPGSPHLVAVHGQSNAPTLEVNPGITPPSRVVTVTGKGFPANKKINITFLTQVGGATATTAGDGTFRASLVIFNKSKPEQRTVVATVDGFPAITANAPLLIVFPTVHPADFVVRG